MESIKSAFKQVHHGLGRKERILLYVLIVGLCCVNGYAIISSGLRYQDGSVHPSTSIQSPFIEALPPFTMVFCTPELLGLWTPTDFDGGGPSLAKGYHHGKLHLSVDNLAPDVIAVDPGQKQLVQDLNCTLWKISDFVLNDPNGLYYSIIGNAPYPNTPGFIALLDGLVDNVTAEDLSVRDFVPLNSNNVARVQLHSYSRLNGTTTRSYTTQVKVSSSYADAELPKPLDSLYGRVYYSFICVILDYYVSNTVDTLVEQRSFTWGDFFTTALTFFNLSFTVVVCCFPRQYLVASVQTFCLNPKPVYDPHRGMMTKITHFRLPDEQQEKELSVQRLGRTSPHTSPQLTARTLDAEKDTALSLEMSTTNNNTLERNLSTSGVMDASAQEPLNQA